MNSINAEILISLPKILMRIKNVPESYRNTLIICWAWAPLFLITMFLPPFAFGQNGEEISIESETVDYSNESMWLCLPGRDDACSTDLTTTIIDSEGNYSIENWTSNPDSPIDCFYVYPTVSTDPGSNSTIVQSESEINIIQQQFARFASHCRPFAPMYRQFTLSAFLSGEANALGLGYSDIKSAWNYYLENYNDGRGFLLIGHSQGAAVLTEIIREEIDGMDLQSQLVGAFLIGTTIYVAEGSDKGGNFQHTPICSDPSQTGCIVSYNAFLSTSPPPADTMFGRFGESGLEPVCTNPATLNSDSSELRAYLAADKRLIFGSIEIEIPESTILWVRNKKAIQTPWVTVPEMVYARCNSNEYSTFLEVNIPANPNDARSKDIAGIVPDCPQCGLHLVEVNLTMGNLLDIIDLQTYAWLQTQK